MLPLLIAQAPGPNTDPDLPLYPMPSWRTGGRLHKLMGITRREYLRRFDRMNLLYEKGDKFPMSLARIAAANIKPLLAGRIVILVGRNVANAFEVKDSFHEWNNYIVKRYSLVSKLPVHVLLATIPHPSGRNPWYSNPDNQKQAKAFWAEFLA